MNLAHGQFAQHAAARAALDPRELRIESGPGRLRQYGLTDGDAAAAILSNSLSFLAGQLRTQGGTIHLHADNRARYSRNTAPCLVEGDDSLQVPLRDTAIIEDRHLEGNLPAHGFYVPTKTPGVIILKV